MVHGRVSVTHMVIARWATGAAWHLSASGPCPLVGCSAGRLLADPGQRHSSAETRDDTNPRPPPAAPSPTSSTWGVCWTMSASGLPCWSVTDAAGGLEDAVACCNPSKLSLSLSAVERSPLGAGATVVLFPPAICLAFLDGLEGLFEGQCPSSPSSPSSYSI